MTASWAKQCSVLLGVRIRIQSRHRGSNACQLITPILLLLFLFEIQLFVNRLIPGDEPQPWFPHLHYRISHNGDKHHGVEVEIPTDAPTNPPSASASSIAAPLSAPDLTRLPVHDHNGSGRRFWENIDAVGMCAGSSDSGYQLITGDSDAATRLQACQARQAGTNARSASLHADGGDKLMAHTMHFAYAFNPAWDNPGFLSYLGGSQGLWHGVHQREWHVMMPPYDETYYAPWAMRLHSSEQLVGLMQQREDGVLDLFAELIEDPMAVTKEYPRWQDFLNQLVPSSAVMFNRLSLPPDHTPSQIAGWSNISDVVAQEHAKYVLDVDLISPQYAMIMVEWMGFVPYLDVAIERGLHLDYAARTWNMLAQSLCTRYLHCHIFSYAEVLEEPIAVNRNDVASMAGTMFWTILLMLTLPAHVSFLITEKQDGQRHLMQTMGLRGTAYWGVDYAFGILLFSVTMLVVAVTGQVLALRMFTQVAPSLWFMLLLVWGNCQNALAVLLSTMFTKTRTASIVTFLGIILSTIVANVYNGVVFKYDESTTLFLLYPINALARFTHIIARGCSHWLCPETLDDAPSELFRILNMLLIDSVLIAMIAVYRENSAAIRSKARDYLGQRLHTIDRTRLSSRAALWLHDSARRLVDSGRRDSNRSTATGSKSFRSDAWDVKMSARGDIEKQFPIPGVGRIDSKDPDVLDEERRVRALIAALDAGSDLNDNVPPLLLSSVIKQHGPNTLAVDRLTLAVDDSQCFGLLGPNGAGKSTTISMLTGVYAQTAGRLVVAGRDIDDQHPLPRTRIGVCPQHDIVFPDLTCLEHVLLYAQLQGAGGLGKALQQHAMAVLQQVGLHRVPHRLVSQLSGGMRRRLSVAIAIAGDAGIILLDEPTTGLDPDSRRALWDVIGRLKTEKHCCVVLTTHSMTEADALCDRIAIMAQGELRCVGTPLHLKARYGEGYVLHASYRDGYRDQVSRFIQRIVPSARAVSHLDGVATFQFPSYGSKIGELFSELENNKQALGIREWSITHTSMEDVFVRICRGYTGPRPQPATPATDPFI